MTKADEHAAAEEEERNPALVYDDTPQPVEKRYKVIGTQPVFDHAPGEEFVATLDLAQEADYLEYGHLQAVPMKEETAKEAKASTEGKQKKSATEAKE